MRPLGSTLLRVGSFEQAHDSRSFEAGTRTIPRGKKNHSKRCFVISQLFSILNSASCEVQRSYLSAKNRPRF